MFMKRKTPLSLVMSHVLCKKKKEKDDFLYFVFFFHLLFNPPDMYIDMKDIQSNSNNSITQNKKIYLHPHFQMKISLKSALGYRPREIHKM